jgi:hypothetical protein
MTDADHGITDADTAGETLSVVTAYDGIRYTWGLWRDMPLGFDGFGRIVWDADVLAEGAEDTQALAEAAGEAARESHLRSLIRE